MVSFKLEFVIVIGLDWIGYGYVKQNVIRRSN